MRTAGLWWLAGAAHLALAGVLAFVLAAPLGAPDPFAHAVVLATGLAFLAGGASLGLWPAFLRREWDLRGLTVAAVALAVVGDVVYVGGLAIGRDSMRALLAAHGAALALLALHVPIARLVGRPWKEDANVLGRGGPFRVGDALALAAFVLAFAGLAAGALLWIAPPRGIPTAGLAALLLGAVAPALLGSLLFLLPREAREPLPGATLVGAALALHALAGVTLVAGLASPVGADFRYPAFAVGAAYVLAAVALLRLRFPDDAERLRAAKPLLRALVALVLLAGSSVPLAFLAGPPNHLLPLVLYAHAVLAGVGFWAVAVLGGRLLFARPVEPGAAAKWAAALATVGLFLVAPALEHPRSAFPGALVLLAALALLLRETLRWARAARVS